MRTSRLILGTLAVLATAGGALLALPALMPEARLRAVAAEALGAVFGRPATIAGAVRLSLLPAPRLVAEDVRLGAAGEHTALAAGRLAVALDPLALLAGRLAVADLALDRAAIAVTLGPDGRIAAPFPARIEAAGSVALTAASLHLADQATGRAATLAGLSARLHRPEAGAPAELVAELADPALVARFAGRLAGSGAEGMLTLRGAAIEGRTRLVLAAGRLTLDEMALRIGSTALAGAVALAPGAVRPQLSGQVRIDRLDLGAALDQLAAGAWKALAGRLDAALSLEAGTVALGGLTAGPTALDIVLAAGRLGAELRELGLYGGRLVGRLGFTPGENGPRLDTALDLADVAIGPLLAEAAGLAGVSGTAGGALALVARGVTAAELLASLDGTGRLVVRDAAWQAGPGAGLAAPEMALTFAGRTQPLRLEGAVALNGRRVAVAAQAGPAAGLVTGGPLTAAAELTAPGARLHLAADATRPFAARGRFRFETRDLADFLAWLGVAVDRAAELDAPARLEGRLAVAGPLLELDGARIEVAGGTASGRLALDRSGAVPHLAATLATEAADLRRMAEVATAGGGQILRALDAALDLTAGQARYGRLAFGRTALAARLQRGVLAAEARAVPLAGGQADLTLRIEAADPDGLAATAELALAEADAATLFEALAGRALEALSGPVSGRLSFGLRGDGLRAAPIDLAAELTLREGRLSLPGIAAVPVQSLRLALERLDAPAAVSGRGSWRGEAVAIEGRIGNPRAVLAGGDAAVELALEGARFAARYDGTVASLLPAPAAAARTLRLALVAEGGTVRAGTPVSVAVTPASDGHLICFYETGAGDVVRIFPYPSRADRAVAAGAAVTVPDAGAGFQVVPERAGRRERFACAHGPAPLVEHLPPDLRAPLAPLAAPLDAVLDRLATLPGVVTATAGFEVAAAVATRTVAPPPPPRLTTDHGDAPVVRAGTPIVLRATAPEDGHLVCFWRFGDGTLMRVRPNAHAPDSAVAAGRTVEIPGAGWPFQIVPETPGAEEQVACLFGRAPVLPRLPAAFAAGDLVPLPDPDVERLIGAAGAIEGVSAARLVVRVAAR